MPDKKMSQFDPSVSLTGNEEMPLIQSGGNVKSTVKRVLQSFANVRCGSWNASTNKYPDPLDGAVGTGTAGAIEEGNEWKIIGTGTMGENEIGPGNKLNARALINDPGQDDDNWKLY